MKLSRQETLRILAIAVMMASLASGVSELVLRVVPSFQPAPLVVLAFLVCLEGVAADRLARQLPDATSRLRFHIVEWVVILLLLRLLLALSQGAGAFVAAAERWVANPASLVDWGLVAAALLLFGVWWLGVDMARAFEKLEPEVWKEPPRDSAAYYAWSTRPQDEYAGEGWKTLNRLFLTGGMILLLASGLARLDIEAMLSLSNPALTGIVGNALLYFALGFVLLAQGHYSLLRTRWERQSAPVAQHLTRRWVRLAIIFTVGVALAALLLPVRPSLAVFGAAFQVLSTIVYYIMGALLSVMGLLGYLLSLLNRLFGAEGEGQLSPPAMPELPAEAPTPPAEGLGWWEAIQGLVVWALLTAVLVYALVRFMRERRDLLAGLRLRGGIVGRLVGWLSTVWRWLTRTGAQVGLRVRSLLTRKPAAAVAGKARRRLRWFRPRNPRERVRLLYLLGLEQLGRAGWGRSANDTPYEYAQRVEPHLPDGAPDLEALTEAFVAARYSRREFAKPEISPLQAAYRRLRQAVRRMVGGQDKEP